MNTLATSLGLEPNSYTFHDVWSLDDESLLSHIPRPAVALLVIIPLTETWHAERVAEDAALPDPDNVDPPAPALWFPQTIGNACGSIGLLHCLVNTPAIIGSGGSSSAIAPGSTIAKLLAGARALPKSTDRAQLLYDSDAFEEAHAGVVNLGDTLAPEPIEDRHLNQHFVAFVKGADGHLWELEGSRKGPLDRGLLMDDEDVLSRGALDRGIGRVIRKELEGGGGDLRFSVIALAPVVKGGGA